MTNSSEETDIPRYFYRRRLPHWQPPGAIIFVTWRCCGSLPENAAHKIAREKQKLQDQTDRTVKTERERALLKEKRLFALADPMLRSNMKRSNFFNDEKIAKLMVDSLFYHEGNRYDLHSFVVMPNHIHLLIRPEFKGNVEKKGVCHPIYEQLDRIAHSIKSYTAQVANRRLGRRGKKFWQEEQYDHWVRDGEEYEQIVDYIESDPERSGLVEKRLQWRWSSAWEKQRGRMTDFQFQWVD